MRSSPTNVTLWELNALRMSAWETVKSSSFCKNYELKLSMESMGGSSELLDPENLGFFEMPL